jgi:hypothetical protein
LVRRSTRRRPLPLAPHRTALPVRARRASPLRRPTSGRDAVLGRRPRTSWPSHCSRHALYCLLSPWCARNNQPPRAGYKSCFPFLLARAQACATVRHRSHRGELRTSAACNANTRHSRLPPTPTKLPR